MGKHKLMEFDLEVSHGQSSFYWQHIKCLVVSLQIYETQTCHIWYYSVHNYWCWLYYCSNICQYVNAELC